MVSATASNWFLVPVLWSAASIFALALAMMGYALVLRARAVARRRRNRRLIDAWSERFSGTPPSTPIPLRRREVAIVLNLWDEFVRLHVGEAREAALQKIAGAQGFEALAIRLAHHRGPGSRLIAMTALGTMRSRAALPLAERLIDDGYGQVSLAAWRAIVMIDPRRMGAFADAIAGHADWQARSVQQVLLEFGAATISRPLARAVERAPNERVLRVVRYLIFADPRVARVALRGILANRSDPEVVAAGLRALAPLATSRERDLVRPFLRSDVAFVRIAAIGALAPIAVVDDRPALLGLLADENAWVRYRAAQAVVGCFPGWDPRMEVGDDYGRDALAQVLAERSGDGRYDIVRDAVDIADDHPVERAMGRMRVEA